jgi:hypothetical protein
LVSRFVVMEIALPVPLRIFKMVIAQQARDKRILQLIDKIKDVYLIAQSIVGIKQGPIVQFTMEKLLKQTIQCGHFIQKYSKTSFKGMRPVINYQKCLFSLDILCSSLGYRYCIRH